MATVLINNIGESPEERNEIVKPSYMFWGDMSILASVVRLTVGGVYSDEEALNEGSTV